MVVVVSKFSQLLKGIGDAPSKSNGITFAEESFYEASGHFERTQKIAKETFAATVESRPLGAKWWLPPLAAIKCA